MSKSSEARMTAESGAQASAKSRAPKTAALSRSGAAEALRASDHIEDDRNDERDQIAGDDRGMSDDEFMHMIRDSINQSVLPDLPKIHGYHTFWATTTNSRDTIPNRLRMGYQFIRCDELPGWEGGSIKTGEYAGCVGINEMVAMKIPERRYQMMMAEFHHRMPMAEEEKIRAMVQSAGENALRDKGKILDEDGFVDNIVQKAPVPHFA